MKFFKEIKHLKLLIYDRNFFSEIFHETINLNLIVDYVRSRHPKREVDSKILKDGQIPCSGEGKKVDCEF